MGKMIIKKGTFWGDNKRYKRIDPFLSNEEYKEKMRAKRAAFPSPHYGEVYKGGILIGKIKREEDVFHDDYDAPDTGDER